MFPNSLNASRRAYHTVGDEMFMNAFETGLLPFEQWTHRAHIRMAYNYILRFGRERAIVLIRCDFAIITVLVTFHLLECLLQYCILSYFPVLFVYVETESKSSIRGIVPRFAFTTQYLIFNAASETICSVHEGCFMDLSVPI